MSKVWTLFLILFASCGKEESANNVPTNEAASEAAPRLEEPEDVAALLRVDIEQKPMESDYGVWVNATISTHPFFAFHYVAGIAMNKDIAPENCSEGEFTRAEKAKFIITGLEPETVYVLRACALNTNTGEAFGDLVKEFKTGKNLCYYNCEGK